MARRDIRAELEAHNLEYLGGTASTARNTETGEILSRRKWERVLGTPLADDPARVRGGDSTEGGTRGRMDLYAQAQQVYQSSGYSGGNQSHDGIRASLGYPDELWRPDLSLGDVRKHPAFRKALTEMRSVAAAERRAAHAKKPWVVFGRPAQWEERLRAALTEIGYRQPDWMNPVGESPS